MGDYTNLTLDVHSADPTVRKAVRAIFEDYSGTFTYRDEEDDISLSIGVNEAPCGSANDLASALVSAMDEAKHETECGFCKGEGCENCDHSGTVMVTLAPFAFTVWEDPKYEWLGELWEYAPGAGAYSAECDADGQAVLSTSTVLGLVRKATDLAALKADVDRLTGAPVIVAQKAFIAALTTTTEESA